MELPEPALSTTAASVRLEGTERVRPEADCVALERALELRVAGETRFVLLRTPGHDEELATGFLWTEGILARLEDLWALERPADVEIATREDVLELRLDPGRSRLPEDAFRKALAACGACGPGSLASRSIPLPELPAGPQLAREILFELPVKMREAQSGFARTGGLHAAALFDLEGCLLALREDVGRHNALDKVAGWALREGLDLPIRDAALLVSGRLGSEIVLKALALGIPILAGLGAASSLAVELAERAGVTLACFLRADRATLYGSPDRIL